jgi:gas vesicle protein
MPDFSELVAREVARQLRKRLDPAALAGRVDLSMVADRIPKQVILGSPAVREAEARAANRGFVGGFLAGAAVGALLALIFAPRRGAETRDLIVHAASDVGEKVSGVVAHGDAVSEAIDTLKSKAEDAMKGVSGTLGHDDETSDAPAEEGERAEDPGELAEDIAEATDPKAE